MSASGRAAVRREKEAQVREILERGGRPARARARAALRELRRESEAQVRQMLEREAGGQ